ncbi:glycosylated lysosomal membrane protein [Myripristis murdjan]|uniref:Glycosylated lysosomal membrane protein n=1 Tax=Myripristis murdjan TaxID=586833 RepID=A0A667YBJ4_9TELE|nr:glycosylated lysosomal membrane protein [Myripristis murdjan]
MAASRIPGRRLSVFLCLLQLACSCCGALLGGADTHRRKLSAELNPGWNSSDPPPPPGVALLHVRALGDNDTLHFLFCSQGAPTLLLVHTNTTNSTVKVDWPGFLARNTTGSLQVEPQSSVLYSSALLFSRLWEYDDVNDTADPQALPPSSFLPPLELQNFSWTGLDAAAPTAQLCASPGLANSSLCLQFSVFESEGRDPMWPRLLHNDNSSQLRVWLDKLTPRANHSRFSLELQAVGGAYPLDRVEVLRSIDDEYTPSIFKVSQWVASPANSSEVLGFVQWKPVAYRQADAVLEVATPCRHSTPGPVGGAAAASGLVRAFYGPEPPARGLNISFGMAGAPLYNTTRFLSWTLLVGVGSPPVDSFSLLVLVIMAVGLGTPMILLLVGGVCVLTRKRAGPQGLGYEPIN